MAEPRIMDIKDQPGFRSIAIICLLVLYVPVLILMIFSLNSGSLVTHWEGVTLNWYGSAFLNEEFHAAARNTLIISVTATIVSTICATLAAIGMTRVKPWRGLAAAFMVINLPLMVPEIITAVATLSFFALIAGAFGLNFGIGNLILAHTVFCIPFAYMPIRARLEDMDLTLEYAAADLYATPWNAFRRITLPLLVPGIMSGGALAFIVSFDDFTITQLVAGPGQTTLPLYIWNQIRRPMTPEINAISTILLMVSILFVSISFLIARRRAK
ncbi:ABC transporter permease [Mesorhizobium humile]|jgi:spermidine/putrescine transport system permease protein|uniref:Spermidine/putrescine transport system permease protein PotC n=1 Tax=Mesorhizobium humile TaxID=3072313 RepID=A0ABU4YFH2_9HYPH|nr:MULTISPECIES: ABC transporter permease [unclassified Mesorhizobium]MDX8457511.1 ABC transporter permease [Mesorhizobium sp. VK2D]MDX8485680.1 ABC transporter permease [Mesorhizobium sp. VK2B]